MKKDKIIKSIIVSITVIFCVIAVYLVVTIKKLMCKQYDLSTSVKIIFYGLQDATDKNYSQTLDVAINSNEFVGNNFNKYLELNYYPDVNYITSVNKLLEIGYTTQDINLMYEKLDMKTIQTLYYYKFVPDISKYLEQNLFKCNNLFRYLDYYNGNYEITVLYVNIGLDNEHYTNANTINEFNTNMLVNKYNKITSSFKPESLVKVSDKYSKHGIYYLEEKASQAFNRMAENALKEKIYIQAYSAYRSYEEQEKIYNNYLNSKDKELINYVVKPGFSEHQTGLAVDIASKYSIYFDNTKEDLWLRNNAYKFGFVLRYPKGKENITGVNYESWHYRYVGEEVAEYIWKEQITFEEYYAMLLDK